MGGLAGHMAHLHESTELTFSDVIDVLTRVANADITATEKVDGQNLFVTVDEGGRLRAARNKSDLKKGGMTPEEFASKWKGHPAERAFTGGFEALQAALKSLDKRDMQAIFNNGNRYINLEVMYPANANMVVYTGANVVLHNAADLEASTGDLYTSEEADEAFQNLSVALDAAEAEVNGEMWRINGPAIVDLIELADGRALSEAVEGISRMAEPVGLDSTLGDYVAMRLRENLERRNFSEDKIQDTIAAVLERPDAPTAAQIKKNLSPEQAKIISSIATKSTSRKYIAEVLAPLEMIVHVFAVDVLQGLKSLFVDDAEQEGRNMRKELDQAISFLQKSASQGDQQAAQLLEKQLQKLEAAGLDDALSTIEGLVFEYPPGSGSLKKITGNFAPLNQLVGRARRAGMPGRTAQNSANESKKSMRLGCMLLESIDPLVNPTDFTVGLVPMSAKPFHAGHWWLIGEAARENDQVIVYVSVSDRKRPGQHPILGADMQRIWREHLEPIMPSNVSIEYGGSPVRKVYEKIGTSGEMQAEGSEQETTYRVYSDKQDTITNYSDANREKYMQPLYSQGRVEFPGESWPDRSETGVTTSGTGMRKALASGDFETFAAGMPAPLSNKAVQEIFDILS